MAERGIREYDGKRLLARYLEEYSGFGYSGNIVLVSPETNIDALEETHPWFREKKLVAKPDQLFGKRGKNDLLFVNKTWDQVKNWIKERMNKEVTIKQTTGETTGILTHFLVEEFVEHKEEYYLAITTGRNGDTIHFSTRGGVNIEEVWETVKEIEIPILSGIEDVDIAGALPDELGSEKERIAEFISTMYKLFIDYHFTYLEFNPFTISKDMITPLDVVAKLDDYASYQCAVKWGDISFPPSFGMLSQTPEEKRVTELDERTGASLKLTILNPKGRVWNLVAGGGASVIYADTVADLGYTDELANYGEYSGNPSTELTYEYTKTILKLMTKEKNAEGKPKYLIVGGGIANFTDVANTFTGIIQAIEDYAEKLKETNVKIFVRRGGPNYNEGLNNMKKMGKRLGLPVKVHGPKTHMTRIVSMALEEN